MVRISELEKSLIRELSVRHNYLLEIAINSAARDPRIYDIPEQARALYLNCVGV